MIKSMYIELAASACLILATLVVILILSRVAAWAKTGEDKPGCRISILYQPGCECFEMRLERLIKSNALRGFDPTITVVDGVGTEESLRWLNALRAKLGYCFEIEIEGGEDNGTKS